MVEGFTSSSVTDVDVYRAIGTPVVSSHVKKRIVVSGGTLREHAIVGICGAISLDPHRD